MVFILAVFFIDVEKRAEERGGTSRLVRLNLKVMVSIFWKIKITLIIAICTKKPQNNKGYDIC